MLFFEDFAVGEVVAYGDEPVGADDIVAFAREFDPQAFHLDAAAAEPLTGGLIASGWHTAALLLKMNCEAFLLDAATLPDQGIEEVRWLKPVRPGDRLGVRRTTRSARPLPEGGEVELVYEVVNQAGETVMAQTSLLRLRGRGRGGAADVL